jgi:biotin synthase
VTDYGALVAATRFSHADLVALLSASRAEDMAAIRAAAERVLLTECGPDVYYRGLVEASNICRCDCRYCGIRKSNPDVRRYTLGAEDLLDCARRCAAFGYGSIVIQAGERHDKAFLDGMEAVLRRIRRETRSAKLPEGLGVTLSLGQQTPETYRRLRAAGAHRYLMRIETANPKLFAAIHPPGQTFESRLESLWALRDAGFQIGTGVMIGLPGQTLDDLAADIEFFEEFDVDMIGMGPFIPHDATPMGGLACPDAAERIRLTLLMIAATRLKLRDVNIASTTALQALDPVGREKGLQFGANVLMPQITPLAVRRDYQLYPGKPCLDDNADACRACIELRIRGINRVAAYDRWGDSVHATKRQAAEQVG